jgi:hypothetical protein
LADNRTPASWLEVLNRRLDERWMRRLDGMGICDAYYEGDHSLAFATAKFREAFGILFGAIADNWCQLVVDSKVERLEVQGFRFGKKPGADDIAWDIWQANGLDAESAMVHTEAAKLGEAYWLVEPGATSDDPPTSPPSIPRSASSRARPATAASASPRSRSGSTKTATSTPTSTSPTASRSSARPTRRAQAAASSGSVAPTTPADRTTSAKCR